MRNHGDRLHDARNVLLHNLTNVAVNGKTFRRTVPSKNFYVHQWNWDSATVAMGLIHCDPDRAYDELRALLAGQWKNGMVPHIVYNPHETSYYPQAEKWRTEHFRVREIITSGITQPPLLAIAVAYLWSHSPDRRKAQEFLDEVLPAIIRYHEYLHTYRDPEKSGLLTIIHPWEGRTDNSPRWDRALERISLDVIPESVKHDVRANRSDDKMGDILHRPTQEEYYRYLGLIDLFATMHWDPQEMVAESPFAIKDILFSSIWARANEALAEILSQQGRIEEAITYRSWAEQTKAALAGTWNESLRQYCDIDVSGGKYEPITEVTIATLLPLYAGAVTNEQLPVLLERLADADSFWTEYPVPTTPLNSQKFERSRYWRGPTWPITNYFCIEGLRRYSDIDPYAKKLEERLRKKTLKMIEQHGFFEYYDGLTGAPYGFSNFSWSAAIYLLLSE